MEPHYYDKSEEEETTGVMRVAAAAIVCFGLVLGAGLTLLGAWLLGKV